MIVKPETAEHAMPIGAEALVARSLTCKLPCEGCGASITLADRGLVTCEYCGVSRLAASRSGLALFIPFATSPAEALAQIKSWLRREGHRATHVGGISPVLVPYWWVSRRLLAWTSSPSDEMVRLHEAVVRPSDQIELAIADCPPLERPPALAASDTACVHLDASLLDDAVTIVAATTDPSSLADQGASGFDSSAGADRSAPDDLVHTVEIERHVTLVYAPFYSLRFTFKGEHHSAIACGSTGNVMGLVPGELRERYPLADRASALPPDASQPLRPLRCPVCDGLLAPDDQVLACTACGALCRGENGEIVPVRAETARGEGLHVPFWRFDELSGAGATRAPSVHVDLLGEPEERTGRYVWVPAFSRCPPALARRLAVAMTGSQPSFTTDVPPASTERLPCGVPVGVARGVASLTLDEIESLSGGPAPGLSFDRAEPVLVWVPFRPERGFLTEPRSGARVSEAIIAGRESPE